MKILLKLIEQHVGPKLSAVIAGLFTLYAQVETYLTGLPFTTDMISGAQNLFATGDWKDALPAPVITLATYLVRRAKGEEVNTVDYADEMYSQVRTDFHNPIQQHGIEKVEREANILRLQEQLGLNKMAEDFRNRFKTVHELIDNNRNDFNERVEVMAKTVNNNNQRINKQSIRLGDTEGRVDNLRGSMIKRIEETQGLHARIDKLETTRVDPDYAGVPTEFLPDETLDLGDVVVNHEPINVRQNNPLNIRPTESHKQKWQGELASDTGYARFSTVPHGIRAAMYLLRISYFQRRGLTTVKSIIERWAPYGDNHPSSVVNYIKHVANDLGVLPEEPLHINTNDKQLVDMVKSMGEFEGGHELPYDDIEYTKALELLGDRT